MIGNVAKALPAAVPAPNQSQFQANMHLSLFLSPSLCLSLSLSRSFAALLFRTCLLVALPARRVPVPDERFDFLVEYHKPAR